MTYVYGDVTYVYDDVTYVSQQVRVRIDGQESLPRTESRENVNRQVPKPYALSPLPKPSA